MQNESKKNNANEDEITHDQIMEAAETKVIGASGNSQKKDADKVLNTVAKEAKDAEHFDHGKNDAGTK